MCPVCKQEIVVKMIESDNFGVAICGCVVSSKCIPQMKPQAVYDFRIKVDKMLHCS